MRTCLKVVRPKTVELDHFDSAELQLVQVHGMPLYFTYRAGAPIMCNMDTQKIIESKMLESVQKKAEANQESSPQLDTSSPQSDTSLLSEDCSLSEYSPLSERSPHLNDQDEAESKTSRIGAT